MGGALKGHKKSPEHAAKLRLIMHDALRRKAAKMAAMTPAQRNEYLSAAGKKGKETRRNNLLKSMHQPAPVPSSSPFPKPPDNMVSIGEAMGTESTPEARGGDRTRIHWTPTEAKHVADRAVDKMVKIGVGQMPGDGDRTGWGLMMDSVREVQYNCLPKDRRRIDVSSRQALNEMFWTFVKGAFTEVQRVRQLHATLGTQAPAPANGNAHPPPTIIMPKPAPAPAPAPSPFDALIDARVKAIVGPLEEMFLEEMGKLEQKISGFEAALAAARTPGTYQAPEKPRVPTVSVLGCNKEQFQAIEDGVKDSGMTLELRHVDQSQSQINLTTEWALFMRFTGHIHWDQAKACGIPSDKMAFVRGGTSSAILQLEAWFKHE